MEAKDHNYGVTGEEVAQGQGPVTMGTQEERTLSVLAHLSMFLNLVTGFLGPVAALIIYLRSTGIANLIASRFRSLSRWVAIALRG
jgi:hypothetical protein